MPTPEQAEELIRGRTDADEIAIDIVAKLRAALEKFEAIHDELVVDASGA